MTAEHMPEALIAELKEAALNTDWASDADKFDRAAGALHETVAERDRLRDDVSRWQKSFQIEAANCDRLAKEVERLRGALTVVEAALQNCQDTEHPQTGAIQFLMDGADMDAAFSATVAALAKEQS